jgi:hypothetical protein
MGNLLYSRPEWGRGKAVVTRRPQLVRELGSECLGVFLMVLPRDLRETSVP